MQKNKIGMVDIVITLGCNVSRPYLLCEWREDSGLDDPTGESDAVFPETIEKNEEKIKGLRERVL